MSEQSVMVPSCEPHWGESGTSSLSRTGAAISQCRKRTLTHR